MTQASPKDKRRAITRPCAHCGLPATARGAAALDQDVELFCCGGCCVAHHLSVQGVEGSADKLVARLVLSAFLSMGVMVFSLSLYGSLFGSESDFDSEAAQALQGLLRMAALGLSAPVMYLLGLPLGEAVVRMRRWLSADALILIGTGAAWGVSAWNTVFGGGHVYYETATMVLVLVSLGRWLDVRARERARGELRILLPERAKPAAVLREGVEVELDAQLLELGDRVRVRPGEVVPVDGLILEGRSFVDASALTGEADPLSLGPGQRVLAGSSLVDGSLVVRAEAVGGGRVRDEVERLLSEAMESPAPYVRLADRVSAILIPLVLALALGTAAWHWQSEGAEQALLIALSVVLISCPCALGIATPLAFWVALAQAWKAGVLVRGGEVLERLAQVSRVWLDKTGTLTRGDLTLDSLELTGALDEREALRVAASLELGSEHPIGRALLGEWFRAHGGDQAAALAELYAVEGFRALPGLGVEGRVEGRLWRVGRGEGVAAGAVSLSNEEGQAALFRLHAEPRPEAGAVIRELKRLGLEPTILTGDARQPAEALAEKLGIPVEAGLLPAGKVERIRAAGAVGTLFIGDGLNDAAALAAADVGIAVAGGSARSMEAAPINLLRPGLGALPELLRLSRAATRVARGNLAWAFGYNAIGLFLAVRGELTPILAAAAMVASSLAVVLNSGRLATRVAAELGDGAAEPPSSAP